MIFWTGRATDRASFAAIGGIAITGAMACLLVLSGCSRGTPEAGPAQPVDDLDMHRDIVMAGSNTIGAELAPRLLAAYAQNANLTTGAPRPFQLPAALADKVRALHDPQCNLDKVTPSDFIEVPIVGTPAPGQPHHLLAIALGSACSAAMVGDGIANVGMSSRPIKPEEAVQYASAGPWQGQDDNAASDAPSPYERVIGLDGVVVVANQQGWPGPLTRDGIRAIFSGAAPDWVGADGAHHPRRIFQRKEGSGTRDTFKALVMGDTPVASTAEVSDDQEDLIRKVSATPGAIGYSGFGAAQHEPGLIVPVDECGLTYRAVDVAGKGMIKTEDYPMTRRLFLYTPGKVHTAHADNAIQFADFVRSDAGQKTVDTLFVSLRAEFVETHEIRAASLTADKSARGKWADFYERQLANNPAARQLGSTIRFASGAAELDPRATDDLVRVRAFLRSPAMMGKHLIAVGFTDSNGSPANLLDLSAQRASTVGNRLTATADAKVRQADIEAIGMGANAPAACNADDAGRARNRRVELWVADPLVVPVAGTGGGSATKADHARKGRTGRVSETRPSPYKVYIPDPVSGN